MNLGRYEIVRELGKGAMGVVYLARDPVIGRLVALKTIQRNGDSTEADREFRERFRREAQSAGRLSHPSIVTIYDIGDDDATGGSFIAMEYLEGHNLRDILASEGRLPHAKSAALIAEIADALDYAHSRGIVHRDVKPANIVLTPDGTVKITDFGIAKIVSGDSSITGPGHFLGTPYYTAPEQIRATANVDGRADIFALGVVLYEALTGRRPFTGDSITEISYRVIHDSFVPLREVDPNIPEAFDAIVNRCLEKDPVRRYPRASDLRADLRAAAGEPTTAGVPTTVAALTTIGVPVSSIFEDPARTLAIGKIPQELIATREERPPDEIGGPLASREKGTGTPPAADRADQASARTDRRHGRTLKPVIVGANVSLIALLAIAAVTTWMERNASRATDAAWEESIARQATLRRQASALIARGDVEGAYAKYAELAKLAPRSPGVAQMVQKLEAIRSHQKSTGPAPDRTARTAPSTPTDRKTPPETKRAPAIAPNARSASRPSTAILLTQFEPGVRDGKIEVYADGHAIIREELWDTWWWWRVSKPVAEYRRIPAGTSKVTVVVTVPSLDIRASRTVKPRLRAGKLTRLTVSLDPDETTIAINLS